MTTDRFAAVKECIELAISTVRDGGKLVTAARNEIASAEQRLADLEGIDQACDAANQHVLLLEQREAKWRKLAESLEGIAQTYKCGWGSHLMVHIDQSDWIDVKEALQAAITEGT